MSYVENSLMPWANILSVITSRASVRNTWLWMSLWETSIVLSHITLIVKQVWTACGLHTIGGPYGKLWHTDGTVSPSFRHPCPSRSPHLHHEIPQVTETHVMYPHAPKSWGYFERTLYFPSHRNLICFDNDRFLTICSTYHVNAMSTPSFDFLPHQDVKTPFFTDCDAVISFTVSFVLDDGST